MIQWLLYTMMARLKCAKLEFDADIFTVDRKTW